MQTYTVDIISHSPQLALKVSNKKMHLVAGCHGRFHGILPKEYSGTFYELPWGVYNEMSTDTQGQSDIVIYRANI